MTILIGLDTETTGLAQAKGHRIIEVALLTYDLESRRLLDRWVQRIDPDRPIDAEAQAIHGIAYSDLVGSPKWFEVAPEIVRRLNGVDLLVAHNMGFDGPFIAAELQRVSLTPSNVPSICTMENGRWACPDGKLPKLSELCFALNVPYDTAKAHSAAYDVAVTMECFFRGLSRGFYELPTLSRDMGSFSNCHDAELKVAA